MQRCGSGLLLSTSCPTNNLLVVRLHAALRSPMTSSDAETDSKPIITIIIIKFYKLIHLNIYSYIWVISPKNFKQNKSYIPCSESTPQIFMVQKYVTQHNVKKLFLYVTSQMIVTKQTNSASQHVFNFSTTNMSHTCSESFYKAL